MVAHVPAGAKVVIEPVVPDAWATDVGRPLAATANGERWTRFPTWLHERRPRRQPAAAPGSSATWSSTSTSATLRPGLLDSYVSQRLLLGGAPARLQAGRAFAQPQAVPEAVAYYARAGAARAKLVYHVSPFPRRRRPGRRSASTGRSTTTRSPYAPPGPGDERLPPAGASAPA